MQIYAIKMFNFLRFGEECNSVVLDLTKDNKEQLKSGLLTMDKLYDAVKDDPMGHIKEINKIGITNLMGISGVVGGVHDRSNGVGKSTVLEAICYALYEKVIRKNVNTDKIEKAGLSVAMKFGQEIAPHVKETYVELIFEENGNIYILKRGRTISKNKKSHKAFLNFDQITAQNINSQSGHRTTDTNESILNVINMDYDVFVNSVMFGQKDAGRFLKGTDKVRKEMLINLLHLENIVTGCIAEVRTRKNAKDKEINSIKTQIEIIQRDLENSQSIDSLKARIIDLEASIKSMDIQIKTFRENVDALTLSDIFQKVKSIKEEGAKVKEQLLSRKKQKEDNVKEWQMLLHDSDTKVQSQQGKIETHTQKVSKIKSQGVELKRKITSFEQNDLSNREIDLELAKKLVTEKPKYLEDIIIVNKQKEELLTQNITIDIELNRFLSEIKTLNKQIENANKSDSGEYICDKCKSKVTKQHLEDEIEKNQIKVDSFQAASIKTAISLKEVNGKCKKVQDKLDSINYALIKENQAKSDIKEYDADKIRIKEFQETYKAELKFHSELETELIEIKEKQITYKDKIDNIGKQYDEEINKLQFEINELAKQLIAFNSEVSIIDDKIIDMHKQISFFSSEKDTANTKIGSTTKEIETINKNNDKLNELGLTIQKESALYNRLVMLDDIFGLEGVQTRIIQRYLPLLNVYVKEMLDTLTDGEISAELYINDRSHVDINIQGNVGDSFNMVSGGEQEDIRLAMSIGLALLSFSRSAQKPEMICLDEIFGSLDDARVASVFKLLALLKDKFGRVIVISHKATINAQIPNQLLLEKGAGMRAMSTVKGISNSEIDL